MIPTTFRRLIASTLAMLLVAGVAVASTITGVVTDKKTGEPLPFVTVFLSGRTSFDAELRRGVEGNRDGYYKLPNIPGGRYEIRFVYIGYEPLADSLTVADNASVQYDAALVVEPIEVEEVVVEADRFRGERDIQTGFVNIDAKTLADMGGVVEADPIRSLQFLPGVQTASDISSGLYIRGGGPDQTLVTLDGVPVYNPTHAFGFFSTFNSDAVGDVTLYKGAYPAGYGGRLNAVLDVNTLRPKSDRVTGVVGVSTIAARATVQGPLGKNHWLVSGRRTYLDPILALARRNNDDIPSFYFYDLNARFETRRDRSSWATLTAYKGRDDIGLDANIDTSIDINWGNTLLAAAYNRLLGEEAIGKVQLSFSQYESLTDARFFATQFSVVNRITDYTLRGDVDWRPSVMHGVSFGVQASLYDFDYVSRFNEDPQVDFATQPTELALYAEDRWTPTIGTSIRAGMRTRYISDGDRLLFEPRLSISQALGATVRVKYGGGLYNQYLQLVSTEGFSAGDFYLPVDNTTDPGSSWQSVIGVQWDPSQRYQLTAEAYYTNLENLVVFDNRTSVGRPTFTAEDLFNTGGEGYATGVELFAQKREGPLTGWVGYTLGWTRRRFDELNGGAEFPPKYDRRHDVSVVSQYRTGKWTFGASFLYATGQAFTPAAARYWLDDPALQGQAEASRVLAADRNSARLLPYHRLDVRAARDFTMFDRPAQVYLQVFNIYNRRNEWFVQFNSDGADTEVTVAKMLPIIPSLGVRFEF